MYLVQIFLPLRDNAGRRIAENKFSGTKEFLIQRFGGLTAFTRAPAEGLWKPGRKKVKHDEIVIFEVTAKRLDKDWWKSYRRRLESRFMQKKILVLAQKVKAL